MKGQYVILPDSVEKVAAFFCDEVAPFVALMDDLAHQLSELCVPQRGDSWHQRLNEAFARSQEACRRFEQQCNGDPTLVSSCRQSFLAKTHPWFSKSWYGYRARTKPSGFPGDYLMLLKLYEGRTSAMGFGGYLDLCLGDLPLAKAVVSRMESLRQFLLEELQRRAGQSRVRILDVACGPCQEWVTWPEMRVATPVELFALDGDPAALQYVQHTVISRLPKDVQLQTVQLNALRTKSHEANLRRFRAFDIIYSVGLCDYLPDRVLIELLAGWYQTLADHGVIYVAFKDADRYDKTPYQWHLDWYFYQRTYEDVWTLYEQAGLPTNELEVYRDQSGIIMNFCLRRTARRVIRLDAPAEATAGHLKTHMDATTIRNAEQADSQPGS